ncbi:hypothetical protein BST96_18555 [Oceanicoccus sagamiensis]|uniref:Uncharacterized protein n=2 Tax=Oceanicoccus sagamiensis TaxID=716816 RepID=A0A1X9NFG8_9GAMM|nr:hypothetical protein BST96_18555 [Oceanicoccus sagamiensis]
MPSAINQIIKSRFKRWLDRRIPATRSITLDQKRIFIFPSRPGRWFIVLLIVMLIAAINYQNNMAFALVFLLSSVFIVSILHTYANLSGLTITAVRSAPVFVGDNAELLLQLQRQGDKDYFDIDISWPLSDVRSVTLSDSGEKTFGLHLPMQQRGWFKPDRLLIETFYPVGLLRAWTWLALDFDVLVYPRPLACKMESFNSSKSGDDDGEVIAKAGSDDFYQFQPYRPGDSLKHAFWKSYAKGQDLQTKEFAAYREQSLWLEWDDVSGDLEQRLSKLCYWVLTLENSNDEYGLRIPGVEITPGHGQVHQEAVLKALALYRWEGDAS